MSSGGGSGSKLLSASAITAAVIAVWIFIAPVIAKTNFSGPLKRFAQLFVIAPTTKIGLLIGTRFILVSMMGIAALVAIISGYNWLHDEGNDVKKAQNKTLLGNSMIMISLLFILMAVFHYFVPDYSRLAL